MRKTRVLILFAVLVFAFSTIILTAKDYDPQEMQQLRIGLTTYYFNQEEIPVYNSEILLGYENNGDYDMEMWFSGYNHYSFEALNGYFIASSTCYSSYSDVKNLCDNLQAIGYPAYPGVKGTAEWYIYLGRYTSVEDAQVVLNDINSSMKDINFKILDDYGQCYKMSAEGIPIVIVDCQVNHPQFMAVDNDTIINLGDRQYRGRIEFGIYGNDSISAINVVTLEEYLYGVLPAEVYYKWEMDALKAQSVAARTYAVYTAFKAPKYASEPYDLDDTVNCQVYKGYGMEEERTNQAVDETLGQIITYEGQPIAAFFYSTSGGHTESSQNVWSGTYEYLKAVPDIEEMEPEKDPWIKIMTADDIKTELGDAGQDVGDVLAAIATSYSDSGRVMELVIGGTEGIITLTKEEIRRKLGLFSRKFTLIAEGDYEPIINVLGPDDTEEMNLTQENLQVVSADGQVSSLSFTDGQVVVASSSNLQNFTNVKPSEDTYIFAGMGYGHGVGMSQSGAQSMALVGYNYIEILNHYYQNTTVEKLY